MQKTKLDQDEVLRRWPRITAHMICESLGYFSPRSAANSVLAHKQDKPFFCEWYAHQAQFEPEKQLYDHEAIKRITHRTLKHAIERRRYHTGYMADYGLARAIVEDCREKRNDGPNMGLASWF